MIKNQRQYEITRAQAAEFADALERLRAEDEAVHPLIRKAQRDAVGSQLEELRAEMEEYEALQQGRTTVLEFSSLSELPKALIQARIASGLTQREVAERLGLQEQAIQRYEKNDYAGASLDRINQVMHALGATVREEVFLPTADVSFTGLTKAARKMGLGTEWLQRVLPASLYSEISESEDPAPSIVLRAAELLGRVFGLRATDLFSGAQTDLAFASAGGVRFKLPARAAEENFSAFTVYAHYLALLVLRGTADLEQQPVPTDADEMLAYIRERYGRVDFRSVLDATWDLGIPVLPLRGPGAFHGACWRTGGRNVVVLKQSTRSAARWSFDLLHELRHAAESPEAVEFGVVESAESAAEQRASEDEITASMFAGNVILEGRAEELAEICVEQSRGMVNKLSYVVPQIASDAGVSTGALANYLAFRLTLQGINWWGAAHNLQDLREDPWEIARDELLSRMNLWGLSGSDRELLLQALSNEEE